MHPFGFKLSTVVHKQLNIINYVWTKDFIIGKSNTCDKEGVGHMDWDDETSVVTNGKFTFLMQTRSNQPPNI